MRRASVVVSIVWAATLTPALSLKGEGEKRSEMLYREHNSPPPEVNGKAVLVVSTRTKQSPRPLGRGLG